MRKTKTASGKTAIQVVFRRKGKTHIVKHVGTAQNSHDLKSLTRIAEQFAFKNEKQIFLFPEVFRHPESQHDLVSLNNLCVLNITNKFAYEFLSAFYKLNGFEVLDNKLVKDLSIVRIIEPASKLRSLFLLRKYFDIKHSQSTLYKNISKIGKLRTKVEKRATDYAQKHLSFDFNIVFYDVSTLYFDAKRDDDFRKYGYSKDGKHNKPQILIALVVTKEGYPIAYDIFEGNKYEGHTILPVILNFKNTRKINNLTIIADAGMLSKENIDELTKRGLNYIVAARMSNLSNSLIKKAGDHISQKENVYFKEQIDDYGALICSYSKTRASKDKSNRKKQIVKAKNQISNPSKVKRRSRFTKEVGKSEYILNKELIEKDKLLDGIKGYYTNLKDTDEKTIIARYKDLWHIEKAFRIAKSDLLIRPMYHWKKKSIEAHILIVFVSLCVTKSIELTTKKSIRKVKDDIGEIQDVHLQDKLTGKTVTKRTNSKVLKEYSKLLTKITY